MQSKVGRNDPCPCGSGKKYKKCCIDKPVNFEQSTKPKGGFQYKAGSYGDIGNFMPSIACLKQEREDEWIHYFVLVKPEEIFELEDDASDQSQEDLEEAFRIKFETNSEEKFALSLKNKGYLNVNDFKIVQPENRIS